MATVVDRDPARIYGIVREELQGLSGMIGGW
jgi:hypothetical protein